MNIDYQKSENNVTVRLNGVLVANIKVMDDNTCNIYFELPFGSPESVIWTADKPGAVSAIEVACSEFMLGCYFESGI